MRVWTRDTVQLLSTYAASGIASARGLARYRGRGKGWGDGGGMVGMGGWAVGEADVTVTCHLQACRRLEEK